MRYREIPSEINEILYDFFATAGLAFVVYFNCIKMLGVPTFGWGQGSVIVLTAAVISVWRSRDRAEKLWGILLAAAAVFLLVFVVGFKEMGTFLAGYGAWLNGDSSLVGEAAAYCYLLQSFWTALAISLLWGLLKKFVITEYVLAAGCALLMGASLIGWLSQDRKAAAFTLVFLLYNLASILERFWEKSKNPGDMKERSRRYKTYLTPIFLLFLLILLYLPEKETPLEWATVKKIVARVQEQFTTWHVNRGSSLQNDFEMPMSGLDDSGKLGGKSNQSDKPFLEIVCSGVPEINLYLTGMTWQTFDGREWTGEVPVLDITDLNPESLSEYLTDRNTRMDAMETLYAIAEVARDGKELDYYHYLDATIGVKYFHSASEFLPDKTVSTHIPQNLTGKKEKMLGYGSEYAARFLQLNLGNPVLKALLEMEHTEDAQRFNTVNYYQRKEGPIYDYEELLAYRAEMEEKYSQEIVLSEAVENWCREAYAVLATEGQELTDVEKLLAIENALSQYVYTKTPGELPGKVQDSNSFLEYFLLEKQEGYCSHYATAFVLLARSLGYPARYCQGFCAQTKGRKEFTVYGRDAHAWPEVYFEGVGWIPFEPTPGFYSIRYTPWEIRQTGTGPLAQDLAGYMAMMEERKKAEEEQRRLEEEQKANAPAVIEEQGMPVGIKLLVASGIFLVICIIFYYSYLLFSARRLKRLSPADRFSWLSERMFTYLEHLGVARRENETLEEFAKRLQLGKPMRNDETVMDGEALPGEEVLQILEKTLYRGDDVSKEELEISATVVNKLLQLVQEEEGNTWFVKLQRFYHKHLG